MSVVLEYVRSLVPVNWKASPSGWTSGNCPMCTLNGQARPDTRGRGGFYFDEEKFQYHCFNCGYKSGWSPGKRVNTSLKKLLTRFGADESDIQRIQLELLREADVAELLIKKERRENLVINWPTIELPEDTMPFMEYDNPSKEWIEAATYLTERGFDIQDSRLMYSAAKAPARMNKRFVIPFTYKGNVVGYTARWIGNPPEGMPKYYNKQPSNYVYGLDRQTRDKELVILTEGPLDAIVVDGISAGTNTISEGQADVISSLNKKIIVLPDRDRAGMEMVKAALKHGWSVSFPEWEDCKDAGDAIQKYGRLFTVRSILNSVVDGQTKIQVLAKRYCK